MVNFLRSKNRWHGLPLQPRDLWDFCLEVGHTMDGVDTISLAANTLRQYLFGVRAWLVFHGETYPQEATERVNLIIRACARDEAVFPPAHLKKAVHVRHLLFLSEALKNGTAKDKAIMDCALVAFWGMARLKELTYTTPMGMPRRADSVLCSDVIVRSRFAKLTVRAAKTGGTVSQTIKLVRNNSLLCPIKAILRRLANAPSENASLFGYNGRFGRVNITRPMMASRIQQLLNDGGFVGLTGHSFRIGGALLQHALGVPVEQTKKLGRWRSDCYKVYIKEYSETELEDCNNLLDAINEV
jgi:hypothetical protein